VSAVPSFSDAALNAIADPNVAAVLRQIVGALKVREGSTRAKGEAFVTRDELSAQAKTGSLSKIIQTVSSNAANTALTSNAANTVLPAIESALPDLAQKIFNLPVYQTLSQNVDSILKPGGLFDQTGTLLQNETKQRIDADSGLTDSINAIGLNLSGVETGLAQEIDQRVSGENAITQTLDTRFSAMNQSLALLNQTETATVNSVAALSDLTNEIQATVAGNSTAIAQEFQARTDLANNLYAQYTLRVDVNGRISGFGLAASETSSDFVVRADTFSIVSPTGNKATLVLTNNRLEVYDENGTLRVRLGRLE
jgi:hypothetical protein